MPNLSKDYLSTLPSITKFLFYSSLSLTLFLSAVHSPFLAYLLPDRSLAALHHYVGLPTLTFPSNLSSLFPLGLHRLLSPFLLHPLFSAPTFLLACASFISLVTYSRHIEEAHLPDPAGAARYTSALLFPVFCIVTVVLGQLAAGSAPAKPPAPYFNTALTLVFYVITLDTTFAPYEALSASSLLQQWHSPWLLLVLFTCLFSPAFTACMVGIMLAYLHHVVTQGVGRVWGVRLWGTPDWLVALYERWGIGVRKIGLHAQEGGVQLGGD